MLTMLDFYADYCVPCQRYDEYLPEVLEEMNIILTKVNVVTREDLVKQYNIQSLPTLVLIDDEDNVYGTIEGCYPEARLREKIKEIINKPIHSDVIYIEEPMKMGM